MYDAIAGRRSWPVPPRMAGGHGYGGFLELRGIARTPASRSRSTGVERKLRRGALAGRNQRGSSLASTGSPDTMTVPSLMAWVQSRRPLASASSTGVPASTYRYRDWSSMGSSRQPYGSTSDRNTSQPRCTARPRFVISRTTSRRGSVTGLSRRASQPRRTSGSRSTRAGSSGNQVAAPATKLEQHRHEATSRGRQLVRHFAVVATAPKISPKGCGWSDAHPLRGEADVHHAPLATL